MAYCRNCGKPLTEGQPFCPNCGLQVAETEPPAPVMPFKAQPPMAGVAAAAQAEPPRVPEPPLAPGWTYGPGAAAGPQAYLPGPPPGRSLKWLWIGLASLVVVAVACVLVFVVFHDQVFGDEGATATTVSETSVTTQPITPTTIGDTDVATSGVTATSEGATTTTQRSDTTTGGTTPSTMGGGAQASSPEDAVLLLFGAMENKDFDAFFALMDPVAVEEVTGGLPLSMFKEYMGDSMWPWESMEFSDLKLETEKTGDTTATVTVVEGIATVTDLDGVTSSDSVSEADEPVTFGVIQRDGVWYLDPEAMFGSVGF